MSVIKKLGERVEKEHDQFLRDSQRLEDRSATANGNGGVPVDSTSSDFETLVSKGSAANGSAMPPPSAKATNGQASNSDPWGEDDMWGNMMSGSASAKLQSPTTTTTIMTPSTNMNTSPPPAPILQPNRPSFQARPSKLGTSSLSLSTNTRASTSRTASNPSSLSTQPAKPNYNLTLSSTPMASTTSSAPMFSAPQSFGSPMAPSQPSYASPNYNLGSSLTMSTQTPNLMPTNSSMFSTPLIASTPALPSMSMGGGLLTPSKPAQPTWGGGGQKQLSKADWGDFDPLA